MPSKFEIALFPPLTTVITLGALLFIGSVRYMGMSKVRDALPNVDCYSPDGDLVAGLYDHSSVSITSKLWRGHHWIVAEGDHRIESLRWTDSRHLEVVYRKDTNASGDPSELPVQKTRLASLRIDYRLLANPS